MIARLLTFGLLSASAFFVVSAGGSTQAAARGAARCMEAVMPKCSAGHIALCAKQSKCKSCAKWSCTAQRRLLPF